MSLVISTDLHLARLAGVLAFLDAGAARARMRIYGTARPSAGGEPGGSYLVEIPLDDPCGTVGPAALTLQASADALITATGAAVWARQINGDGVWAWDADVAITEAQAASLGVPQRAGQIVLSHVMLYEGGLVRLVSAMVG